uniref:Uncharacterized protein n=1 Tax=Solanum lycopersicum TaxID=4081 RepID=A0A3Q7GB91_SOLLC
MDSCIGGNLSVDVLPNGNVNLEGIVRASITAPTISNRRTRRIFPLGRHFTINFTLPGTADPTIVRAKLDSKGTAFKRWIVLLIYLARFSHIGNQAGELMEATLFSPARCKGEFYMHHYSSFEADSSVKN